MSALWASLLHPLPAHGLHLDTLAPRQHRLARLGLAVFAANQGTCNQQKRASEHHCRAGRVGFTGSITIFRLRSAEPAHSRYIDISTSAGMRLVLSLLPYKWRGRLARRWCSGALGAGGGLDGVLGSACRDRRPRWQASENIAEA